MVMVILIIPVKQKHTTGTPAKAHNRNTIKITTQQHQQKHPTGTPEKAPHRHTSKITPEQR